jgi:hypothetical protein
MGQDFRVWACNKFLIGVRAFGAYARIIGPAGPMMRTFRQCLPSTAFLLWVIYISQGKTQAAEPEIE